MYSLIGWLNVSILAVLILPYVLRLGNRYLLQNRLKIAPLLKALRNVHKPLGVLLLVTGLIHGYLALGGFRLHSGSLLYFSLLTTAVLGGAFYRKKKKVLLDWHRIFMLITIFLLVLHLLMPSYLYYLMRG